MNKLHAFVLLIAITACGLQQNTGEIATNEADYTQTAQVLSFDVLDLKLMQLQLDGAVYLPDMHDVQLQINLRERSYSGLAACNRFFGAIELVNQDAIRFLPGGHTEMVCDAEAMQWQARIFNALHDHTFTVNERADHATLIQVDGNSILAFTKVELQEE